MSCETPTKVKASHLSRDAYLYVRQSTLRQVLNNTESTVRQYDLRQRAVALGWPAEQIIVVDVDQGHSGASAADREGFQRLVADVSMGRAGIVLGLECSRLARNNADWHRLLEICCPDRHADLRRGRPIRPGRFQRPDAARPQRHLVGGRASLHPGPPTRRPTFQGSPR